MKKIAAFILLIALVTPTNSAVVRGADGRWYGNICVTQVGWQVVPWQPVGSMCYSTMWKMWGFIVNQ